VERLLLLKLVRFVPISPHQPSSQYHPISLFHSQLQFSSHTYHAPAPGIPRGSHSAFQVECSTAPSPSNFSLLSLLAPLPSRSSPFSLLSLLASLEGRSARRLTTSRRQRPPILSCRRKSPCPKTYRWKSKHARRKGFLVG
jgi:hypothetical protein